MANLAVAKIESIVYEGDSTFGLNINYAGIGGELYGSGNCTINGISPNVTTAELKAVITTQIKSQLSDAGYTVTEEDGILFLAIVN